MLEHTAEANLGHGWPPTGGKCEFVSLGLGRRDGRSQTSIRRWKARGSGGLGAVGHELTERKEEERKKGREKR